MLFRSPEHVADKVLEKMGKPSHKVYQEFLKQYYACCKKSGKEQYAVPYFMSSHPGCGLKEAVELAEYIRDMGFMPEQVQDFYPTPSTISTCMYYTGLDPRTMEKVYVPVNPHEKNMQRALIQYRRPENRKLVEEALIKAGRQDLIGFGPKCLIRPYDGRRAPYFRGRLLSSTMHCFSGTTHFSAKPPSRLTPMANRFWHMFFLPVLQ